MNEHRILTAVILGAPNVGKSTFFNKFIGGRRAIVDDRPGVTRDRLYAEVNFSRFLGEDKDLRLNLIDTGGVIFADDSLNQAIEEQVIQAISESDFAFLLVDGRVGVTSTDRKIAKWLRKHEKRVVVIVNKLDSPDLFECLNDFRTLGFDDVLPFSAKGKTFKSCLKGLVEELGLHSFSSTSVEQTEEKRFKVALLGRPNAGKSSLLNALFGSERAIVDAAPGTTRDAIDTPLDLDGLPVLMIDTAGLRRKSKVLEDLERFAVDRAIKALVRADLCVLVLDSLRGIEHQDQKIASLIVGRQKGGIILLNKSDQQTEEEIEDLIKRTALELSFLDYAPILSVSAKDKTGLKALRKQLVEIGQTWYRQINSATLNQAFRELLDVNPSLAGDARFYKIKQSDVGPPEFTVYVRDPKKVEERSLQVIARKLRADLGLIGAPIRWQVRKGQG